MKFKNSFLLITILLCFLLFGCNDKSDSFRSAALDFKESYLKATDFFNPDEDRLEVLKKMDPNIVEPELKKMSDALSIMSNEMKTEDQKDLYNELESDYEDLKYLLSVYNKFDDLNEDEKMEVEDKLVYIFIIREAAKGDKDN